MEMTQFAMVEELAQLVKDNLFSKHLILSAESTLVEFLQNDTSPNGVLELEPMSAYHRLLLHRLAEIFGFFHDSIGEGDDRHLVLERCPDSSIPPVLVSDILGESDDYQPAMSTHILSRKGQLETEKKAEPFSPSMTIEEREMAYMAARERIFALDLDEGKDHVKPKPRNVPDAARRMIAHALGQRILPSSRPLQRSEDRPCEHQHLTTEDVFARSSTNACNNIQPSASKKQRERKVQAKIKYSAGNAPSCATHAGRKPDILYSSECSSRKAVSGNNTKLESTSMNFEKEHVGAAKRMFAHALGVSYGKGLRSTYATKT